jgi:hypothetical protein
MNKIISPVLTFFKTMNKWQAIVLIIAIGVAIWVLLQAYVFRPLCLNAMCPAQDPTVWPRIGFLVISAVLAIWILKSPKAKSE